MLPFLLLQKFWISKYRRKEMKQNINIILASGSPRRRELFEQVGLTFSIVKSNAEERITKTNPKEVVTELALQKAGAVQKQLSLKGELLNKEALVVGADTIVVLEGKILGKPRDEKDALEILMSLSGKEHSVFTGVSGIYIDEKGKTDEQKSFCFAEETVVTMYPFQKEEAEAYIRTKEPMDKAGAYGIQGLGAVLVKEIKGDYNNVVGFPIASFVRLGCQKNFFRL
jgi:septum formation protein